MADWQEEAEEFLGIKLHRHANGELCGPCPKCREGEDRLIAFQEGNFWCRRCGHRGWWSGTPATRDEIEAIKAEREEKNTQLLIRMRDCRDWIVYHENVVGTGEEEWAKHGIGKEDIEFWGLGYCAQHPWVTGASSLTIPVFYKNVLVDIRHRLVDFPDGNKYRSHIPGLIPSYFNLDHAVRGQTVYVVEGEKKAIVMRRYGYAPTMAYPGTGALNYLPKLITRDFIGKGREFVFLPDPGSMDTVEEVAREVAGLGHDCYVVDLLDKPDDVLLHDYNSLGYCLRYRRRMRGAPLARGKETTRK